MQQQNYNQPQTNKVVKTMNAAIVTGVYFSKKENKNKKSYLTIGKLFIYASGGMSLKLDALPIGNQSISFYEIKPKPQPTQQGYNPNQTPQQQPQQQNYNNNNQGY
jgi:hypothetical protein